MVRSLLPNRSSSKVTHLCCLSAGVESVDVRDLLRLRRFRWRLMESIELDCLAMILLLSGGGRGGGGGGNRGEYF